MGQNCIPHRSLIGRIIGCSLTVLLLGPAANGQRSTHPLYHIDMPPGVIGQMVSQGNPSMRGYVQPVDVQVPEGAEVSIASEGAFQYPSGSLRVGLLVGQVYRLKVANIPRREGGEVYPSVELISRLHPPPGQKSRFPIPIQIGQDDLELALSGKLVVRVVYVENPNDAFPHSDDPRRQRYFDVLPGEDPLHVADDLGRPIAILRLGSRMPGSDGGDSSFLFGSPPVSLTEWVETIEMQPRLEPILPDHATTPDGALDADDAPSESDLGDPFIDDQG